MSFMAGLAEGFNTTFREGLAQKEQRKQDTFRAMYDDFKSRREEVDKTKKEDRKTVAKAKALTEGLDVPQGAWIKAYEWLQAGLDEETVAARLSTGTFKATEMPAGQVGQGGGSELSQQTDDALRPEMAGAPGAPKGADAVPQTPQASGTSGIFQESSGIFTQDSDYAAEAAKRIASIAGVDPAHVQQIIAGGGQESSVDTAGAPSWTAAAPDPKKDSLASLEPAMVEEAQARTAFERDPSPRNQERHRMAVERVEALQKARQFEQMTRAKADAASQGLVLGGQYVKVIDPETGKFQGTVEVFPDPSAPGGLVDSKGEPVDRNTVKAFRTVGKTHEEEEMLKISKDLVKPALDHQAKQTAFLGAVSDYETMARLVEQDEGVLAERTGDVAQAVAGWVTDIKAGVNLLTQQAEAGQIDNESLTSELNKLDETVDEQFNLMQKTGDYAAARALFQAKSEILAFRLAQMKGFEGRSLTDFKYKIFRQLAGAGNTKEKFYQNANELLTAEARDIRTGEKQLINHPQIQTFMETFGYDENPFFSVEPLDDLIEADPEGVGKTLKFLSEKVGSRPDLGTAPSGAPKAEGLKNVAPRLAPGVIVDGYRYKGGDNPNDPNNWERVN